MAKRCFGANMFVIHILKTSFTQAYVENSLVHTFLRSQNVVSE